MPLPMRERTSPVAGTISTSFVEATEPDYVVTLPVFSRRSIEANSWFLTNYELLARLPLPVELWDSKDVLVYRRSAQVAMSAIDMDISWEDNIGLTRVRVPAMLHQGSPLPIVLVWKATGTPTRNWKVFIHLLNERAELAAQGDGYPDNGNASTVDWTRGDVVIDQHSVDSGTLSPGTYNVLVGLYDYETGARLKRSDGSDLHQLPMQLRVDP